MSEQISELALKWVRAGRKVALATVVETWGSAPREIGSQLVIADDGEMQGSVSGGCVEGAVVTEALAALRDGKPRLLEYGVADDDAFSVGLACGGTIRVLVEPVGSAMPLAVLEELVEASAARKAVSYVTHVRDGGGRLDAPGETGFGEDGETFRLAHNPPLRLLIVGAVHVAQHLAPMAKAVGFDVFIIDPRPAFANGLRFPDERLIEEYPDDAFAGLGLDASTAVVTLTHDPKIDDPAIVAALQSDVFYLGALGSKRTHAKRVERLGLAENDLARIDAPVGLDIGAKGPAEIAVSVIAGVIAKRSGSVLGS